MTRYWPAEAMTRYWPAEPCETCGVFLFKRGTPGVPNTRYPIEAEWPAPQPRKTFDIFPEHSPARCQSRKKDHR